MNYNGDFEIIANHDDSEIITNHDDSEIITNQRTFQPSTYDPYAPTQTYATFSPDENLQIIICNVLNDDWASAMMLTADTYTPVVSIFPESIDISLQSFDKAVRSVAAEKLQQLGYAPSYGQSGDNFSKTLDVCDVLTCKKLANEVISICDTILNVGFESLVLHYDVFTKIYDKKDTPKSTVCTTVECYPGPIEHE